MLFRSSTALAEREDPEVVQSLVGRAFDRLAVEIERYGGLLEKFMGDAVLAVFGVPQAHEDDPERAVRAALELQAVLSELNRGFAAEGRPTLAMRVGVEAGEVLVDLDRAAGPRDRMLTGDAVNTASRLEGLTKEYDCELVVSEETVGRAGLDLSGFARHEIEIRGKREMLAVRTLARASDLPRHGAIPVRGIEPAKPAVAVLPADP